MPDVTSGIVPPDSDHVNQPDNNDTTAVLTCDVTVGTFNYGDGCGRPEDFRPHRDRCLFPREDPDVTPSDVQSLFLDQLGLSLGDEMLEYTVRRFLEGGAAAVPVAPTHIVDPILDPVRRFAEIAGMLGDGAAVPADLAEPLVH